MSTPAVIVASQQDYNDLRDRVRALDDQYREEYQRRNTAPKPGFRGVSGAKDPAAYRMWFERLTAENPNWCLALTFVEGGEEPVRQYARAIGADLKGVDWRTFAAAVALKAWSLGALARQFAGQTVTGVSDGGR